MKQPQKPVVEQYKELCRYKWVRKKFIETAGVKQILKN